MTTITITRRQLRSIASLGTIASSDDVTPLLGTVHVSVTAEGKVTAIATDRYRAGLIEFTVIAEHWPEEAFEVKVTARLLRRFVAATSGSKFLDDYDVTLGDGPILYIVDNTQRVSFGEEEVKGTFPPIGRMLVAPEKGGVADALFNGAYLAGYEKLVHPHDSSKVHKWRLFSPRSEQQGVTTGSGLLKNGPAYLEREVTDGRMAYTVQPHLENV